MGLFDDVAKFFETRLDEFLRAHPELELQAIEEQLRQQEADLQASILSFATERSRLEGQILETAQDIQRWHSRIAKVEAAGELKLAAAAREREAALLRQGNQLWGQMEGVKARAQQAQTLLEQVRSRLEEVRSRAQQARSAPAATSTASSEAFDRVAAAWGQANPSAPGSDSLEEQFLRWETDEEIAALKRKIGR